MNNKMVITVGSVTVAIRAKKILQRNGIRTGIVKLDQEKNGGGCTHGIEFFEKDLYTVAMLLRNEAINYKIYSE